MMKLHKLEIFKAANPQLNLNDSDIRIENDEPLSNHPSRVRVTITKGELTKQFISTFDHMDFLKWINLRNDYTVTWTSQNLMEEAQMVDLSGLQMVKQ